MDGCCIACTGKPVAVVHDGCHRKPICEVHTRLYKERGYTVTEQEAAC